MSHFAIYNVGGKGIIHDKDNPLQSMTQSWKSW